MIDAADIDLFEDLTKKALEESDGGVFINRLIERERFSKRLAESLVVLNGELAERFYDNEVRIIERLEEERMKLMMEIDRHSKIQKARRSYSPRFPLLNGPFFLDTER